jgi:hypothetical protein
MGAAGGGLYAITATLYISGCTFSHNIAQQEGWYFGRGGGLYLANSIADIRHTTFYGNIANKDGRMGYGGGLYLECRDCRIENNVIRHNWAGQGIAAGKGGGICVSEGAKVAVIDNEIAENIAGQSSRGDMLSWSEGGGLWVVYAQDLEGRNLIVERNRFFSNTAALQSADRFGLGGGLSLWSTSRNLPTITIRSNLFQGNVASRSGQGGGGAIQLLWVYSASLESNTLISNAAAISASNSSFGGGIGVWSGRNITLDNNILAANRSGGESKGDGIYLYNVQNALFRHNTLAENGPNGVYLTATRGITFINTIVATHTVGVIAAEGAHVLLDHTLWYGNGQNIGGPGVITETHGIVAPPDFIDPARWNYHIGPRSWAIDRGTPTGIFTDIDGDERPQGDGYDIGADEALWFRLYYYLYLPVVLKNR